MNDEGIKVRLEEDFSTGLVTIDIVRLLPHSWQKLVLRDRVEVAGRMEQVFEWLEVEPMHISPADSYFLQLPRELIRPFLTACVEYATENRIVSDEGLERVLATTKDHLEDMRQLVFRGKPLTGKKGEDDG